MNGLRHGNGIYETGRGEIRYEGQWRKGLRHGKGKMSFKSGGVYEGEFIKGYKCGWGRMTYPSGNYYEGEWAYEKKDGFGTTHWINSKEKVRYLNLIIHNSIMVSGKTTNNQVLVYIFDLKRGALTKFLGIDMKDTGLMDKGKGLGVFTMRMEQNMKENGVLIWKKDLQNSLRKPGKFFVESSRMIGLNQKLKLMSKRFKNK